MLPGSKGGTRLRGPARMARVRTPFFTMHDRAEQREIVDEQVNQTRIELQVALAHQQVQGLVFRPGLLIGTLGD